MVQVAPLKRGSSKKKKLVAILQLSCALVCLYFVFVFYYMSTKSATLDHHHQSFEQQLRQAQSNNVRHKQQQQQDDASDIITVGYAVSVTGCGADPITEGAAVLKHSIHLASRRGDLGGRYDYKMYAIYHPNALRCASPLKDLGYTLLERDTPVQVGDIQGDFLREKIEANGCCGEKELIKLEAYTLTQHPIVVHLDLDVLVLKPLDELYDLMVQGRGADTIPAMWNEKPIPDQVNAFFTRDYNMVKPSTKNKPVQGGFLVLRPDMDVYNEFVSIVREGNFQQGKGWGGKGGVFYGSMTFQGIVPYYYDILHPDTGGAIELNRCVYNQMCDNPRDQKTVNDVVHGNCRTGQPNEICEDCRSRPLEDVVTTHFTLCQKPWLCLPHGQNAIQHRLCKKLHHEWFRIRSDLEQSWGRNKYGPYEYEKEHFYGYCKGQGGYKYIEGPYYPNISSSGSTEIERRQK